MIEYPHNAGETKDKIDLCRPGSYWGLCKLVCTLARARKRGLLFAKIIDCRIFIKVGSWGSLVTAERAAYYYNLINVMQAHVSQDTPIVVGPILMIKLNWPWTIYLNNAFKLIGFSLQISQDNKYRSRCCGARRLILVNIKSSVIKKEGFPCLPLSKTTHCLSVIKLFKFHQLVTFRILRLTGPSRARRLFTGLRGRGEPSHPYGKEAYNEFFW